MQQEINSQTLPTQFLPTTKNAIFEFVSSPNDQNPAFSR